MKKITFQNKDYQKIDEKVMLYENILMDVRYFKRKYPELFFELKRQIEEIK